MYDDPLHQTLFAFSHLDEVESGGKRGQVELEALFSFLEFDFLGPRHLLPQRVEDAEFSM